jgi:hypothetical protein
MALLAHSVGFREPRGDFSADLIDALEPKCVQMIARRESFDAAKARILQATRQDHVAVHPVFPNDECCETHPDLESNPRLLWQDCDWPVFFRDFQQLVEDDADIFRLTGKVRRERISPTGVGLIAIGKDATAA